MFYELVLLRRQNQGRFAMAWVASTRGIKTLIKDYGLNRIREINICVLSDEIMEYLISNSINPRERVSLRMAVLLIQGTIAIYQKQVSIFQDDLYRYYTNITTFPKDILSSPQREKCPTQRMFKTPPTPVVKEKRKRKRSSAILEPIPEDYPREPAGQEVPVPSIPQGVPSELEARKESISIVEAHSLQVILPDDMFGDLDVGPTAASLPIVPPKPPSELSEKSQLERIEELLMHEEKAIETRKKISSSSSSVNGGPKTIQVEAMVHRDAEEIQREPEMAKKHETVETVEKGSSSSSGPTGPVTIVVEAMVHRTADEETPVVVPTIEIQPEVPVVPQPMAIEEIQPVADVQEQEKAKNDEEIQSILEKTAVPKKRTPLRPLQMDDIPSPGVIPAGRISREERKKILEKEEKIAKYLRLKFRTAKRVVRLDIYDVIVKMDDIPITIFEDVDILYIDLTDFHTGPSIQETNEIPLEQMRQGSGRASSSDFVRRASKLHRTQTPVDVASKSSLQLPTEPLRIPQSGDFMSEFHEEAIQSTPYRKDAVLPPQKKLYEETQIEIDIPAKEPIERQKEQIVSAEPLMQEEPQEISPRTTERLTPIKRKEDERKKNNLLDKIKSWDESQGYLLVDDVIPTPKNRLNAAKTFLFLLEMVKDGFVSLLPEEDSLYVKYVKKGRLLL